LSLRHERPRRSRAAEQRDELAPFLIESHALPHAKRGIAPQDIELAVISQRVVELFHNPPGARQCRPSPELTRSLPGRL
jgi:hypothetical protein